MKDRKRTRTVALIVAAGLVMLALGIATGRYLASATGAAALDARAEPSEAA